MDEALGVGVLDGAADLGEELQAGGDAEVVDLAVRDKMNNVARIVKMVVYWNGTAGSGVQGECKVCTLAERDRRYPL